MYKQYYIFIQPVTTSCAVTQKAAICFPCAVIWIPLYPLPWRWCGRSPWTLVDAFTDHETPFMVRKDYRNWKHFICLFLFLNVIFHKAYTNSNLINQLIPSNRLIDTFFCLIRLIKPRVHLLLLLYSMRTSLQNIQRNDYSVHFFKVHKL